MEELLSRRPITDFIEKICQDNSIPNYKITDVKTNQKGEGYLGEIFLVTVSNGKKQLDMVIKAAFNSEKVRELVPIKLTFQNEIYFYSEVHPRLHKLETENGIKKSEYVPRCLKVCADDQKEMLALENLRISGFEVFDKRSILDHDHVKLIFETYGRFHAYSYVLRDQKPEEYSKIAGGLLNMWAEFGKQNMFGDHLVEINKLVEASLVPGEDDKVIEKYKEKYSGRNIADFFFETANKTDEYCGILHGDCWSNNMMFKYANVPNGRKPTEMRLIDWQIVKEGSPVCDLSYCLYSGASKEIFDNLNDYLKIYHDTFSFYVKKMGSDPDKLYPFAVLKRHWKQYAKFGMIMSFNVWKMKLTVKEDLIDFTDDFEVDNIKEVVAKMRFDEDSYNKRVRELVLHMFEEDAL